MSYYDPTTFAASVGDLAAGDLVPLDSSTPAGIFETNGGNRYLIAEHGSGKVAIALRHRCEKPYLWKRLTKERCADGLWLGTARVVPIHRSNLILGQLPVGSISSDALGSSILCRATNGDCRWINLGDPVGEPFHSYDHWHIETGRRFFFEHRSV